MAITIRGWRSDRSAIDLGTRAIYNQSARNFADSQLSDTVRAVGLVDDDTGEPLYTVAMSSVGE